MGKHFEPTTKRSINGGFQHLYRFPNGYGASVVSHYFSYGHEEGLWELAVIHWPDPENQHIYNFDLTYETPVTGDVVGRLTPEDVTELLTQIEALPAKE